MPTSPPLAPLVHYYVCLSVETFMVVVQSHICVGVFELLDNPQTLMLQIPLVLAQHLNG